MEIELDLRTSQKPLWYAAAAAVLLLVVLGLGAIGAPLTPRTESGRPRLLSWPDWRFIQAEKAYQTELGRLRTSADQLIQALQGRPSPVAVQLLAERVLRQTAGGDPALEAARAALAQAALDVRDWSAGVLPYDQAAASLQAAIGLLQ